MSKVNNVWSWDEKVNRSTQIKVYAVSQVDVYSHVHHREDRLTRALWEDFCHQSGGAQPQDGNAFRESGISHTSVLSPPLLVWDLRVPTTPETTGFCEFHMISLGHVTYFLKDGWAMFSESFQDTLRSTWVDKSKWSLTWGGVPRYPGDGVANMNGVEREIVGKHADIVLWKYLSEGVEQRDMGKYFRPGVRNALATRFAGLKEGETDRWTKRDWEEHEECYGEIPWRRYYTEYICRLSRMCRVVGRVYHTRSAVAEGGEMHEVLREYMEGARLVYGADYWSKKSIGHRIFHLPRQTGGEWRVTYMYVTRH